jgi:hypothetical protein
VASHYEQIVVADLVELLPVVKAPAAAATV